MAFNPSEHLIQLPRKQKDPQTGRWETRLEAYLEVRWRVLWFRQDHPHGLIISEEVRIDLDKGYARYRAVVVDGEGGKAIAHGTETAADFPDFCERAETRAIGRALALMGYGTAHVGQDLTEGEHVCDAPVTSTNGQPPEAGEILDTGVPPAPEPPPPLTADQINALVELAHSVGVDLQAFGHDMRRLMGLAAGIKVSKKLLRERMTPPQYESAWQAYSDRLKHEVEQSLAAEDVPDPVPPPSNGQGPAPELAPDARLRWGALSRRSMQVGLSASVWESLRQGDYAAAERVIMALEGNGHAS